MGEREPNLTTTIADVWRLGGSRGETGTFDRCLRVTPTEFTLFVDAEHGRAKPPAPDETIQMFDVRSVELLGDEEAKDKVGAVILFGVLGGLAAKNRRAVTYLTVHLKSGDEAYFLVRNKTHIEVRAALSPILREVGVPFHDDLRDAPAAVPVQPVSVVVEIEKAWRLLQEGAVTQQQYEKYKDDLLDGQQ